ncbi:hypothetical protein LF1_26830 [Rubripirellula obstinata]|uniref:Uncharacterized protein n=1 Tax=Rubripirellula obstinata TaxID=406547 RepID=A0A5B1CLD9_9BACT|nr:hypothetical protein LF1_26830 [Rubripirellula obstinata]
MQIRGFVGRMEPQRHPARLICDRIAGCRLGSTEPTCYNPPAIIKYTTEWSADGTRSSLPAI